MLKEWLPAISEVQPLWPSDALGLAKAVFCFGPVAVSLPYLIHQLRSGERAARHGAAFFLVGLAAAVPLALHQVRWGMYVGALVAVPWTQLLAATLQWKGAFRTRRGTEIPLRAPLFLAVLLGHFAVASAVATAAGGLETPDAAAGTCRWSTIAPFLAQLGRQRKEDMVLMSFAHQGPEIAYRTGLKVVGSPYQRNAAGVLDTHDALGADPAEDALPILRRRLVSHIVLCQGAKEAKRYLQGDRDTLVKRLFEGRLPAWLHLLPLPPEADPSFLVLEVGEGGQQEPTSSISPSDHDHCIFTEIILRYHHESGPGPGPVRESSIDTLADWRTVPWDSCP